MYSYYRAYNTFVVCARLLQQQLYISICLALCTEHGATCSIFGTTVTVFFLNSVQIARNIMRLFLDKIHARDAQMFTRTHVWLLGKESACTTRRWALLFGDSDGECIKNSLHRAGPLVWCWRPRVHRKLRLRRKAVSSPFLSTFFFGGGTPFCLPPFFSFQLYCENYDGCCTEPSEKFHVRILMRTKCTWWLQDVLLLCCRLGCGAPTKKYTYPYSMMHCRLSKLQVYWDRATLPPFTSIISVAVLVVCNVIAYYLEW